MSDEQRITLIQSDPERIIDLVTTLIGLGVLYYAMNPDPFDRFFDKCRNFVHGWVYRVSVWEAMQAIRSLPETEE